MNETEYEQYRSTTRYTPAMVSIDDISLEDRTLAYGYTTERDSWHCYMHDGEIHVIVYDYMSNILSYEYGTSFPAENLRPNKRVYPDCVDEEFAYVMAEKGCSLTFLGNFKWDSPEVVGRALRGDFKGRTRDSFPA